MAGQGFETFVWPEAAVTLWTGSNPGVQSGVLAYGQDISLTLTRGWDTHSLIDGTYRGHVTGMRADLSVGFLMTPDLRIQQMIDSTAYLHVQVDISGIHGSAGYVLYSGFVDQFILEGAQGQSFKWSLGFHNHQWFAYGG